nr:hypothetical protein [Kibdelosporangium sp. MJ126-NF4]CEL17232.1 hypothetical protein [Kibdelosporangium sp. MJ126-NF4]CTQ91538.1 hypothetical protein [Kibdelosporangium sp. MJ126-NF4]
MFRKSAILAVALVLTSSASAAADEGRSDVVLEPGSFIRVRDGIWYGDDYVAYNEFSVRATAVDGNGASLFLSLPPQVHVLEHEGANWTCTDVVGGIECVNPDQVDPGTEWPSLRIRIDPDCERTVRDSFDVYDADRGHRFGVPFICYPTGT